MTWSERIAECNRHEPGRYVPLVAGGVRVGAVRRDRLDALARAGDAAWIAEEGCVVRGNDFAARCDAFTAIVKALAASRSIRRPTGELYPVATTVGAPPLALVDRAAVSFLGVASCGVHVNGWVRGVDGPSMWIATRARDKPLYPGLLDNMVAGGHPHGIGLMANVVKECGEEAGIPRELAGTARSVGFVSYVREDEFGLRPDTLFCFDLELPREFVPRCVDGEVESFELLPIDAVAALARDTTRFKFNCNLVILDFLLRHGRLDIDDAEYLALAMALHRPLPE